MKLMSSTISLLFGEVTTPGTFDPRWALFSANSFIAAMLAIYIAFRLGLQRPYWAMLTVYLTAQPLAGAVRSRAVFRLIGTILGASAAVLLVPVLVGEPVLLVVAVTSWAGFCLYVSLRDRTPRSYAFILAGFTATTVAFSSVASPETVFDIALARVEEIALGICCATIVHSLLFPRDVSSVLRRRVETSVRDARSWTAKALHGCDHETERAARQRLAADVTELEMLSTHLPFDTAASKPSLLAIRALQDCLAVVLPSLAAIEDRITALRAAECRVPELDELLRSVRDWANEEQGSRQTADSLVRRCEELTVAYAPSVDPDWGMLLASSVTVRLPSLISALAQSRELSSIIYGACSENVHASKLQSRRVRRTLHKDSGLAILSVFALFLAVFSCCAAWILAAWPEGATASQMAAIYVALHGALDDPAPSLASFAVWTAAALPIAAVYLFVIFPAIDGFPMLVLSLAPAFLVVGYLQASPRHFLKALALLIGLIGALDLQIRFSADFASFLNVNLAEVVGIIAAFLAMRALRSVTAVNMARRLLRHGWLDLAILASVRRPIRRERWLGVMLDRLGLTVPRLSLSGPAVDAEAQKSLQALQLGLELIDLRLAMDGIEDPRRGSIETVMTSLSRNFKTLASGNNVEANERQCTLSAIDSTIRDFASLGIKNSREAGLSSLVGLRCTLFPDALPLARTEMAA